MTGLQGKRLLVVSGDSSDVAIVKAAQEMGVYVICCDRHTDWNLSIAKKIADEAWDMDYSDTEAVAEKCRERAVDGVIAGYSENRVLAACRIAAAIGSPFYATEEQILFTRDKRRFKDLCQDCGVAVPREFCRSGRLTEEERASICYPVIVKPADNGGRKGISVCYDETQLDDALALAYDNSFSGKIVVEEYLSGIELSAVYTIADGEISLSRLNDKYPCEDSDTTSRICSFVISPSAYYKQYRETSDPGFRQLLQRLGVRNGVANFQLIASGDELKAFEMGLRVNGNDDFKAIDKYNGINFMKMLISYSLTGSMGNGLEKDNPSFPKYVSTLCVNLRGGVIGAIEYTQLERDERIDDISVLRTPGTTIVENGTSAQKAMMVDFSVDTIDEVSEMINTIQDKVSITDITGESMLLKLFNAGRLTHRKEPAKQ